MYKILHLFRLANFTETFINFINKNFTEDHHVFWVFGDKTNGYWNLELSLYKNVRYVADIESKLKSKEINGYDKIFYHGVFEVSVIDFFFWNRRLLRKLYLYFWGGDKFLHGSNIQNFKKKSVVKYAHAIIYILPEERKFLEKHYCIKGKRYRALYATYDVIYKCDMIKSLQKKEKDFIAIQIGNSATSTNNHFLIMKKLAKFKDENIRIFVPLSYGDKKYSEEVIKYGQRLFGEKFVAITNYMNEYEYYRFMDQMDIGLFGMRRQQAVGNIWALLYLGKKVYLRKDSVLEHYFAVEQSCEVEQIERIAEMDFGQFIGFEQDDISNNQKNIRESSQVDLIIRDWKRIFNDRGRCKC